MKFTRIITAKIEPDIYQLIEQGKKHYEIRDEDFDHADAIRYVSSADGRLLGMYALGLARTHLRDESTDQWLIEASGLGRAQFDKLFGQRQFKQIQFLYSAEIGRKLDNLDDLFKEDA